MSSVVLYCRSGFEGECAAEIQERAGQLGVYGYCKTQPNTGMVLYVCMAEEADHIGRKVSIDSLVFARQLWVSVGESNTLSVDDRVTPLLELLPEDFQVCGQLWTETTDTNDGRALSPLCKKITPALTKALRAKGVLTEEPKTNRPTLHVLFRSTHAAMIGYSYSYNHAPYAMGIPRIRSPKLSPSRSGAKLAEAFKVMVPKEEYEQRIHSGMNAVDLGACPGGWTAVLVAEGMMVSAVDNGAIDEQLMETGQVKHFREDGFVFRPKKRNVHWLVCDMVEKPVKVAHLMADWFIEGYCENAMFNLKLPMKQRYAATQQYLEAIKERLAEAGVRGYELTARHLYHDREEITVYLRKRLKS
ncbi:MULTISPECIES: 23S rRNA (cytidine(2498)-2'-O)-methyltransferase RlmM [Gammaproteobacteria]|uniref:23S rRNA (cytidine(2498)-2'-O)-methyltransferase RlmM n=1 Tax=Gammaproteobacteria TaxID=1236 RepID=UPI000DCFA835|nr:MULTISPECIES: 23S rRNA (cytidine(2498)-2'-O)-methyltransferase RlmM [Gammaproteobacteria]RTE86977.1 23S rRNA (cytidine(2498)-2'-O)-methyltransferase RlmM [Aliidiomarina sp. B3213]TCZ93233.1 23S rRNA (cytidine(2498)-2'-O)-methyltransferase RlmM [Lysobacter sp. N42]